MKNLRKDTLKTIDTRHTVVDQEQDSAAAVRRPSPFAKFPGYQKLLKRKAEAQESGVDVTFFAAHEGVNANIVTYDGREYVNFSGYNYLGLSGHPQVSEASKAAIDRYGTSVSASRIVAGEIPLHGQLERAIADFIGTEESIVFVSGYGTNVAAISHLFGRRDLVVHDSLAHNSIITGCRLSGAKRMSFPHNDWDALDKLLSKHRAEYQRVLIAIESVYSMDGDIADLNRAIEIKNKHDTLLMVDEAHSLGILGEHGKGISEMFDIDTREVDIWMGTLSKSLASCGGYIAGDHELCDYLRYLASGFIFSVGLAPADTAAGLAALEVLKREPERVARLKQRSELFVSLAKKHGFDTGLCQGTPVVPLIIGNSIKAMKLSERLFARGYAVQPVIYPAVSEDEGRLRFFITALHTKEQIANTIEAVAEELSKVEAEIG
ncbi:MAG TPA: aminotransferase class I/II-fold pyridoxal phosphate-dependent enzyme [Gammaproteobacteria bacterium]|nr:aminotransferase class I/II-fold pyridoxal phosphate-dependent enzyme [Gammaproteobacteria bacterium]